MVSAKTIRRGSGSYLTVLADKFKEVLLSVLPITVIVLLMNITIIPLETPMLMKFLLGATLIVVGLGIFLIGVDIGIVPLGSLVGGRLAKTNKLWIVVIAGLILGFFISIAEPGLMVLANQVHVVTSGQVSSISILLVVSFGLAIMVAGGLARIVYDVKLSKILIVLYLITFVFALFTSSEFLAISFDASGATTGILAVPFILALSAGVSSLNKNSKSAEEDSFGLLSIASVGAILCVMILSIIRPTSEFAASLEVNNSVSNSVVGPFIKIIPTVLQEGFFALLPLLITLLVLQKFTFKLTRTTFGRMLKGFVYTFMGLFLFLVGVNAG